MGGDHSNIVDRCQKEPLRRSCSRAEIPSMVERGCYVNQHYERRLNIITYLDTLSCGNALEWQYKKEEKKRQNSKAFGRTSLFNTWSDNRILEYQHGD